MTEFEFITALAFHWFARRQCDIVVLEVGLGGRFDATNAIDAPEAAVIASISLDHTAILGDTLDKIAFEKAGIVKPGGRLVLYPWQAEGIVEQLRGICKERGAELILPDTRYQVLEESLEGHGVPDGGRDSADPVFRGAPSAQRRHRQDGAGGAPPPGWRIPDGAIREGFAKAFLPARMEVLSTAPLCLLDGGHNPGCAAALRDALERFVPSGRWHHGGDGGQGQPRGAAASGAPVRGDHHHRAGQPPGPARGGAGPDRRGVLPPGAARPDLRGGRRPGHESHGPGDALIVCGSFYLAGRSGTS